MRVFVNFGVLLLAFGGLSCTWQGLRASTTDFSEIRGGVCHAITYEWCAGVSTSQCGGGCFREANQSFRCYYLEEPLQLPEPLPSSGYNKQYQIVENSWEGSSPSSSGYHDVVLLDPVPCVIVYDCDCDGEEAPCSIAGVFGYSDADAIPEVVDYETWGCTVE